ncbi:transglycosylase domain-containing protein [Sphingomonas kaistensis]|uniref:transglycosylase domain-containing protein n=1 Tax=Sphingomonas kaistensis TaxID=298708 RepID=UPI001438D097|nr:PBP1A family penicillin-binding protein [Sphingomonas kaistensis]
MARQPVRSRSASAAAAPSLGVGGWLLRLFKWGLVAALLGLVALGVAVAVAYTQLPSYQSLSNRDDLGQNIRVRSADGKLLVQLGPNLGQWIPYDRIPPTMRAAMIAVEDRRFRSHPGVDPIGLGRAVVSSVASGGRVRATSTITQQLARNIFLTNSRTFGRKAREGVLALALEAKFSKDQILELYLNRVYFGGGAYGIDAASRTFFGHSASRLSLGEATIIAGLVKAPSNYSPTADIEAARGRAGVVLNSMVRNGFVTADAAASVDPAQIMVQPSTKQNSVRYFTDWALPQLDTLIDETNEPIEVWTTLDTTMQGAADRAINANTPTGAQGALVALDRDGAVRALVGGRDYVSSIYNRATQAQRQPGSAFKLFVYLAALESGMKPTTTVVDEPIEIEGWRPRNSTRTHLGAVSLREAFARSINTISAKIGAELGFGTIADMARRFGITSSISTYPSMVLGTSDVRLIDMTRAYAAVAARGVSVSPYAITRVTSADGRLLYRHSASEERTLVAPWVAAGMTDLLQTAVMSGTGRAAQIGRPVAGKTGTTQSNRDGWFIGFSSGITAGVWMGRDDSKAISGLQGGTAPARAFRDFMVRAVANRPVEQFQTEVPMPDWQLEPGEENYFGNEQLPLEPLVDENGNPIGTALEDPLAPVAPFPDQQQQQPQPQQQGPTPDQTEVDRIFSSAPPPPERPQPAPQPRPERAPLSAPADGAQRRPESTQF